MASRVPALTVRLLLSLGFAAGALAQQGPSESPTEVLQSVLVSACRQDEQQFVGYLTAENATAFRNLPESQRRAFMSRLVQVPDAGRPLLSEDTQGRTVVRCETSSATQAIYIEAARVQENLAFVPVQISIGTPGAGSSGRKNEFGFVREDGRWRLLSLGLLMLKVSDLAREWAEAAVEAQEAAAVAALHRLAEALRTYRDTYKRLPERLEQLGPAREGVSNNAANLVDTALASGRAGGYLFRYRILPSRAGDSDAGFELAATPIEYGKTGRRSFLLDAEGVLRGGDKQGAVATPADPRVKSG